MNGHCDGCHAEDVDVQLVVDDDPETGWREELDLCWECRTSAARKQLEEEGEI